MTTPPSSSEASPDDGPVTEPPQPYSPPAPYGQPAPPAGLGPRGNLAPQGRENASPWGTQPVGQPSGTFGAAPIPPSAALSMPPSGALPIPPSGVPPMQQFGSHQGSQIGGQPVPQAALRGNPAFPTRPAQIIRPAQGAQRRSPSFAPPPPRFRPEPEAPRTATRRKVELGEDPTVQAEQKRPWLAWVLAGVGGLAAIALIVALIVNLGASSEPPAPTIAASGDPTVEPTSTRPAANPVVAQPGLVPITQDAKFEPGIAWRSLPAGNWRAMDGTTRDPNKVAIEDPVSGSIVYFTFSGMDSAQYTDDDLTRSQLQTANLGFVLEPDMVGEPFPYIVHGQGGYDLELLAQKVSWGAGSDGWVITRLMPQSDSKVEITVLGTEANFENPNSSLGRKLAEITFDVK